MEANLLKNDTEARMKKALEGLANELKKIRTGRAQVSMLDSIRVDYYGTPSPISQVASVSTPDAKSFLITPWETSILKEIESSIVKSDIGMTPMNDGKVIRLRLPELTEQRRKELVKLVNKVCEDARVAVRLVRRDANESLKVALKDKAISEDDNKKMMDDVQKITDKNIAEIDRIAKEKEKDILSL
jgi:ribosome recycling factor